MSTPRLLTQFAKPLTESGTNFLEGSQEVSKVPPDAYHGAISDWSPNSRSLARKTPGSILKLRVTSGSALVWGELESSFPSIVAAVGFFGAGPSPIGTARAAKARTESAEA